MIYSKLLYLYRVLISRTVTMSDSSVKYEFKSLKKLDQDKFCLLYNFNDHEYSAKFTKNDFESQTKFWSIRKLEEIILGKSIRQLSKRDIQIQLCNESSAKMFLVTYFRKSQDLDEIIEQIEFEFKRTFIETKEFECLRKAFQKAIDEEMSVQAQKQVSNWAAEKEELKREIIEIKTTLQQSLETIEYWKNESKELKRKIEQMEANLDGNKKYTKRHGDWIDSHRQVLKTLENGQKHLIKKIGNFDKIPDKITQIENIQSSLSESISSLSKRQKIIKESSKIFINFNYNFSRNYEYADGKKESNNFKICLPIHNEKVNRFWNFLKCSSRFHSYYPFFKNHENSMVTYIVKHLPENLEFMIDPVGIISHNRMVDLKNFVKNSMDTLSPAQDFEFRLILTLYELNIEYSLRGYILLQDFKCYRDENTKSVQNEFDLISVCKDERLAQSLTWSSKIGYFKTHDF